MWLQREAHTAQPIIQRLAETRPSSELKLHHTEQALDQFDVCHVHARCFQRRVGQHATPSEEQGQTFGAAGVLARSASAWRGERCAYHA